MKFAIKEAAQKEVEGTLVTAKEIPDGNEQKVVIKDDYVLVCDGFCTYSVQADLKTGTHVITITGRRD